MAYKHETARRHESKLFEGVVFYLNKMTEGRRFDLKSRISEPNKRVRDIMREQSQIEKQPEEDRDTTRWLDLQDEFDVLIFEKINPEWVQWGCKKIEGIESDGKPLSVEDWREWPSALFDEVLTAIRGEAELQGAERKNSPSLTTSGEAEAGKANPSTVVSADEKDSGEIVIADSTTQVQ